jgi:type I restriction enzyme S subunit
MTAGFNFSELNCISQERDALLRKGKLRRYDTVLTTRGTVGNVAYYGDAIPFEHVRINSGMVILRPDIVVLNPLYLSLFLRSRIFEAQVESLSTGSAQPQLPIRDIKRVEITIPPLAIQYSIAHILGTLDDKIE